MAALGLRARRWNPWLPSAAVVRNAIRLERLAVEVGDPGLRPLAVARTWRTDPDRVLAGAAASLDAGGLVGRWHQSCGGCRHPMSLHPRLDTVSDAPCPACGARVPVVLARDLELILSAPGARQGVARCPDASWSDRLDARAFLTHQALRQARPADRPRVGAVHQVGAVAVLFTDLVGSTGLYADVGDAAAFRLVMDQFAVLEAVTQRQGGVRIKGIGDALMAAFADPAAAVRAALAFQVTLAADPRTEGLRIRVGVHWGPCLGATVQGVFDVFGGTVNVAARLERQAEDGGVAISQAVLEAPGVQDRLAAEPGLERSGHSVALKGLDGAWEVTRLRHAAWRGASRAA